VIKIATTGSTTVSQIPTNWNMLYGSSVNGSSVYDFGWNGTTQTLAVMDYTNRTVSIFDLNVNVQTVASGTQTASLSGTTPLAKQGAGTLVADQAGAIATNTAYVEQGTLQIGSGGTSGVIGSPVAVTVSSGADSCGGYGHAPNTDGANIGGHDITVRDFVVHNGDDCVPITTGPDGTTSGVLVERVECHCGTNGVVIYNQGGTISGVVARNVNVVNTNQGAGVKISEPGRDATGGHVTNVTFTAYHIDHPRYAALYVNVFEEDAQPPCSLPRNPDLPDWLTVDGLDFSGVTGVVTNGQSAGCFRCTPGRPCSAVFDGVSITQDSGAVAGPFVCLNMKGAAGAGGSAPSACAA
jgi:hypothetical protein